jgi:hypothetical protein
VIRPVIGVINLYRRGYAATDGTRLISVVAAFVAYAALLE